MTPVLLGRRTNLGSRMAKTSAQIQRQIDKLQKEKEALQAKEAVGVIARIKEAIAHYGLTEKDLFGPAVKGKSGRLPGKAAGKTAAPKATPVIKYRDEAGNTWTGNGKRPNWFKTALAEGKKPEDLEVK